MGLESGLMCSVYNLIRVFLDSTESLLSLESSHMPVNGIWCLHIFLKFNRSTKCANFLVVMTRVV